MVGVKEEKFVTLGDDGFEIPPSSVGTSSCHRHRS